MKNLALRPNYAFNPIAEQALRSNQLIVPQRVNAALAVAGDLMAMSIYYSATRRSSLSSDEVRQVRAIASRFSVDARVEEYVQLGEGLNWESFSYSVNPGRFTSA